MHYVIPREIVTAVGRGDHATGAQLFDSLRDKPQAPIEAPNVRCRSHGGSVIEPSDGDYLIYAKDVKKLGKGNYERGCRVLDQLMRKLQRSARRAIKSS
jgi:hypothetical protein